MRILVVGSGAREHALVWMMARFGHELHAAPGNPGIAKLATCHPVKVDDLAGQVALAKRLEVELVVIGPEQPLVAGLADLMRAEGLAVFGPGREAARIEGSKSFAKEVMREAGVPTARWASFDDADAAERHAASLGRAVVKADGLAAGKGAFVARDAAAARAAVDALMRRKALGEAGSRVVVEELLEGKELSVIALCDGERYLMLDSSRDHKRLEDGDQGPNTGGMGAFAPVLSAAEADDIGRTIVSPVLQVLRRRGTPFVGALYAGLMLTDEGPKVLEFNCRMGDPETQPLMMQLASDPAPIFLAAAHGDLGGKALRWHEGSAVAVVLAAHGYPASPRTGDRIDGPDDFASDDGLQLFHAGTREEAGRLLTAGGRVLTVCARGASLAEAHARAYEAARGLSFAGMHLRRDIAAGADKEAPARAVLRAG